MRTYPLLALLFAGIVSQAQDYPRKEFSPERLADEIFPVPDQNLNYQDLYENLVQLLANPIDLNHIKREELQSLLVLSEEQINSFIKYRDENGPLLSVYELQSVAHFDRETFEKVIPFVTVPDIRSRLDARLLQRMLHEQNNYLLLRYQRTLENRYGQQATDSAHRYQGTPDKLYIRYRVTGSNDFSLGFTAEKDAGEALRWDPSRHYYGTDFISVHAQVQHKGRLNNLIIGDFQSQFGQGLILGSVFGFGKNSETITTTRRSTLGFLPYTSINENLFFRGVAGSYQLAKSITLHGFLSSVLRDANIPDSAQQSIPFSSLASSGLHRTEKELHDRQRLTKRDAGLILDIRTRQFNAGLILHDINFGQPYLPNPTPYNQYSFRGIQNQNIGLYYQANMGATSWSGEFAYTRGHGLAATAGMLANINSSLEVSMLFRSFARDFYSFTANAFSESPLPQNERGLYAGFKNRFNRQFTVSGYLDLFQFPWLRFRAYAPTEGSEWLARVMYTPSRNVHLYLQLREEDKPRNLSGEANLFSLQAGIKRNYWISADYRTSEHLHFKTRVQWSSYQLAGKLTSGMAVVQDVQCSFRGWSLTLRYALFDTDDFDNRQYIHEGDVWLAYSFPAYYGVGIRNLALIHYQLSSKVDLWFRWTRVRYFNRADIGSGGDRIDGNTENDLKFQVRIRF